MFTINSSIYFIINLAYVSEYIFCLCSLLIALVKHCTTVSIHTYDCATRVVDPGMATFLSVLTVCRAKRRKSCSTVRIKSLLKSCHTSVITSYPMTCSPRLGLSPSIPVLIKLPSSSFYFCNDTSLDVGNHLSLNYSRQILYETLHLWNINLLPLITLVRKSSSTTSIGDTRAPKKIKNVFSCFFPMLQMCGSVYVNICLNAQFSFHHRSTLYLHFFPNPYNPQDHFQFLVLHHFQCHLFGFKWWREMLSS